VADHVTAPHSAERVSSPWPGGKGSVTVIGVTATVAVELHGEYGGGGPGAGGGAAVCVLPGAVVAPAVPPETTTPLLAAADAD
jgi:hypothetical protein